MCWNLQQALYKSISLFLEHFMEWKCVTAHLLFHLMFRNHNLTSYTTEAKKKKKITLATIWNLPGLFFKNINAYVPLEILF